MWTFQKKTLPLLIVYSDSCISWKILVKLLSKWLLKLPYIYRFISFQSNSESICFSNIRAGWNHLRTQSFWHDGSVVWELEESSIASRLQCFFVPQQKCFRCSSSMGNLSTLFLPYVPLLTCNCPPSCPWLFDSHYS